LHLESAVANLHEFRANSRAFLIDLAEEHRLMTDHTREQLLTNSIRSND